MSATVEILQRSLQELRERERKLLALTAELKDVRAGIRALEKAVGSSPKRPAVASNGNGTPDPSSPRARFGERVLELLAPVGEDGLSADDIAGDLGRDNDTYLQSILSSLVGQGKVDQVDDRYRLSAGAQ